MGWKDTIQEASEKPKSSWRDSIQEGPSEESKSPIMAATTGLIEGHLPFIAGPLAGIGKTAVDAITGTRGPLAGQPLSDLKDDFTQTKDSFEKDYNTARDYNPVISLGASALPIGGAALKGLQAVGAPVGDLVKTAIQAKFSPFGAAKKVAGKLGDYLTDSVAAKIAAKQAPQAAQSAAETAAFVGKRFDPFTKKFY